jgi:hypothetical protein
MTELRPPPPKPPAPRAQPLASPRANPKSNFLSDLQVEEAPRRSGAEASSVRFAGQERIM